MARYRVGEFVGGLHDRGNDYLMNITNPTTFSSPDLTYTTANSSGTAGALRADDSLAVFSTTAPVAISTSTVSSSTGDNAFASREDHVHGSTAITAAASKTEMESASASNVFASPGNLIDSPSAAKVWCQITAAGALNSPDLGVASVTDTGTGDRTVVLSTDFSSTVYSVLAISEGIVFTRVASQEVGSFKIRIVDSDGSTEIDKLNCVAAYGDQ